MTTSSWLPIIPVCLAIPNFFKNPNKIQLLLPDLAKNTFITGITYNMPSIC